MPARGPGAVVAARTKDRSRPNGCWGREFGPAALAVNPFGLRDGDRQTLTGYAVGGGIETAALHNFTVNVDYLAIGLGKETFTFVNPLGTSSGDVGWRGQTFRIGFNWLLH